MRHEIVGPIGECAKVFQPCGRIGWCEIVWRLTDNEGLARRSRKEIDALVMRSVQRYAVLVVVGFVVGAMIAPTVGATWEPWKNHRYEVGGGGDGTWISTQTHETQAGANNYLEGWAWFGVNPSRAGTVASPTDLFEGIKYAGDNPNREFDLKDPGTTTNWVGYSQTNNYWRVKNAQWLLFESGYLQSSLVDGYWGATTYFRTCTFQNYNSLTRDGIIGYNTWVKMNSSYTNNPNRYTGIVACPT